MIHKAARATAFAALAALMLGTAASAQTVHRHALPFLTPGSNLAQQGVVRIVNESSRAGTVEIHAIDDTGERFGPVTLEVGASQSRQFNSRDLEDGNAAKGLSGGIGDGEGNWRLQLETALDIHALAYLRTPDGFLTEMHSVVPQGEDERYHVLFFNPASNRTLASRLRIVNPHPERVAFTIRAIDADGMQGLEPVRFAIPANAVRTFTSSQLESRFGDGEGKWRLYVSATKAVSVMNLMVTGSGHITNLSPPAPQLDSAEPTPARCFPASPAVEALPCPLLNGARAEFTRVERESFGAIYSSWHLEPGYYGYGGDWFPPLVHQLYEIRQHVMIRSTVYPESFIYMQWGVTAQSATQAEEWLNPGTVPNRSRARMYLRSVDAFADGSHRIPLYEVPAELGMTEYQGHAAAVYRTNHYDDGYFRQFVNDLPVRARINPSLAASGCPLPGEGCEVGSIHIGLRPQGEFGGDGRFPLPDELEIEFWGTGNLSGSYVPSSNGKARLAFFGTEVYPNQPPFRPARVPPPGIAGTSTWHQSVPRGEWSGVRIILAFGARCSVNGVGLSGHECGALSRGHAALVAPVPATVADNPAGELGKGSG